MLQRPFSKFQQPAYADDGVVDARKNGEEKRYVHDQANEEIGDPVSPAGIWGYWVKNINVHPIQQNCKSNGDDQYRFERA